MKLNKIPLISYESHDASAAFVLDCDFETALALDGQELKITDDDSQIDMAVYGGYHITAMEKTAEGYARITVYKVIDPETAQAISALEQNLTITNRNLTNTNDNVTSVRSQASSAQNGVNELTPQVETTAEAIEAILQILDPEMTE